MRGRTREPNGGADKRRTRREAAKNFTPGDSVRLGEGRKVFEVVDVCPCRGTAQLRYPRGPRLTNPIPADRLVRA